jgi:DNA-binding GntR family transcriptional regulator
MKMMIVKANKTEFNFGNDSEVLTGAANDVIYRRLRSLIMYGEIPPKTSMTLRGIGNQFGVSMTPAREAVRRLVAEGALNLSVSGRLFTPELTNDRLEELATLRSLLEPELASRALPRAHPALIERMEKNNANIRKAVTQGNSVAYIKNNLEFHRSLYLRAQAPSTLALLETVWLQLGPTMRSLYGKMRQTNLPQHHLAIISALKAGDESSLRLAVKIDVTQGLRLLKH